MLSRFRNWLYHRRIRRAFQSNPLIEIDPLGRIVVPRTCQKGRTVLRDSNGEY